MVTVDTGILLTGGLNAGGLNAGGLNATRYFRMNLFIDSESLSKLLQANMLLSCT